jgi:lipopolysaccharide biosynthesis glycosyltransferase
MSIVEETYNQFEGLQNPARSKKNAIVIAADENYLPAACCAVISCRRSGRVTEPLFLVLCDVSDASVEAAGRFLRERRSKAEIIRLHPDLSGYRVSRHISPAAYLRLHLDTLFDNSWQRLLYLDADTWVRAPLTPLLRSDLGGRILGAITEPRLAPERLAMKPGSPYFNSGVLLFEWPALLSSGLLDRARRFALESYHLCREHDQDVLNKAFEGAWTPLPLRWNSGHIFATRLPRERALIKHYTERHKPWGRKKQPFWIADGFRYWYTLRRSPWSNFARPVTIHDLLEGVRWLYRTRVSERPSYRVSVDGMRIESIGSDREPF